MLPFLFLQRLRKLREEFHQVPELAQYCSLTDVVPPFQASLAFFKLSHHITLINSRSEIVENLELHRGVLFPAEQSIVLYLYESEVRCEFNKRMLVYFTSCTIIQTPHSQTFSRRLHGCFKHILATVCVAKGSYIL